MCGVFHNRSRIVMTLIFVPLLICLLNTENFFVAVGFDPEASAFSQQYINMFIPGIYLGGLIDSNRRLLNSMGYQYFPMISQICVLPLHILWCYILVDQKEMGIKGSALASSITNLTNFIAMWIYTSRFTDDRLRNEAWFIPTT
jgi:Na+-driven multidrug efflux pump